MIRIDTSEKSHVIICDCGWRAIRLNINAARAAGIEHQRRAHKHIDRTLYFALYKAQTRGAAKISVDCPQVARN